MSSASIFVSYRRVDSQHASFAIADRLRWAFGADSVFLDHGSIRTGNHWPASLREALQAARVMLVVVGPSWLSATDEWGRRRIDDRGDWVRMELLAGLERSARGEPLLIVPVFLDKAPALQREALDRKLADFAELQRIEVRAGSWERDLEALIVQIASQAGLTRRAQPGERNPDGSPARPRPDQQGRPTLDDAQVREALAGLPRWQLRWTAHPWGAGGEAQEIAKSFDFESFAQALAFMAWAGERIEGWKPPHHPRWENQWKVVNVAFSTWDVDCRVTALDLRAAREFEAIVAAWRAGNGAVTSSRR